MAELVRNRLRVKQRRLSTATWSTTGLEQKSMIVLVVRRGRAASALTLDCKPYRLILASQLKISFKEVGRGSLMLGVIGWCGARESDSQANIAQVRESGGTVGFVPAG